MGNPMNKARATAAMADAVLGVGQAAGDRQA